METLPMEIADKIFNQIFRDNPRELYGHRRVSKSWKEMIDRCTARLVNVWCTKCSDEIPQNILDEFIQAKSPQTWQEYCSNNTALAMPHIPREIYESRNTFPNLVGCPRFTEIYSTMSRRFPLHPLIAFESRRISSYAINDDYFAISISSDEEDSAVRIYSLNDLTHCIRVYLFACKKMDFFATDNRVFIVLLKYSSILGEDNRSFLAEFLVDEDLIPINLPEYGTERCLITKNQCFTHSFDEIVHENMLHHQQLTPELSFESSTVIPVPFSKHTSIKITNIQICNSYLFVFISCLKKNRGDSMVVYKYQITQQSDGKLFFSAPKSYLKILSIKDLQIYLGADNVPLRNSDCDLYPRKFHKWIAKFFQQSEVYSVTIYPYHMLITCPDKLIVFRGNFRQLMDYAVNNTNPESRCTVINVRSNHGYRHEPDYVRVHVVNIRSTPQFLIVTKEKASIVNIIS